jgi:hypothetical protein
MLQPEDHRVPVVCYRTFVGAGLFLDVRVVRHQHVLVDLVPPVLPFWEMLQVCERMPGLPQMRDDRCVLPRHHEYLVE